MGKELLRIEHVTKSYGKTVANRDISFTVNAGETAVLLGPNGAGKSTIIKCIAGLLRFKGGIFIDGEPNKTIEAKQELSIAVSTVKNAEYPATLTIRSLCFSGCFWASISVSRETTLYWTWNPLRSSKKVRINILSFRQFSSL